MSTTEPLQAEVVPDADAPSGRRLDVVRHEEPAATPAIVAAANAALEQPGAPGAAEFMALAAQARILSLSGAAPKAIRENPYIAFHVALIGRDFGLSVAAAAELVDIIDSGGGPRISLSPQLLNGQIRRLGLGSVIPIIQRPDLCIAAALAPSGEYDQRCKAVYPDHRDDCRCHGVIGVTEFTWEDAQTAELVSLDCQPGEHKKDKPRSKNGRTWKVCGCNQGYLTYPKRMMWWRAAGFCADDHFPEASLGLYSPEALGAPVDDDGRAIDPATVALPEGYEPAPDARAEAKAAREAADATPADELALLDLQIRVAALPDPQRAMLAEKWKEHDHLAPHKLADLPQGRLRFAQALVSGFESAARSATRGTDSPWDVHAARATVVSALAALCPQGAPADDPGSHGPPDQEEPQEGDGGATSEDPPARSRHPGEDPSLAEVLAELGPIVEEAPQDMVDRISAEVKALHHSRVDALIREHGADPGTKHIDTRRMMLCAFLIADEMEAAE